jgi:CRP/FNR family transcriptional regulator, anaerobic regulatory protein
MEIARFVEAICGKGESLYLPTAGKVIVLREGTLAIDAMPAQGGLQILDFLVAGDGDVVSASIAHRTPGIVTSNHQRIVGLFPPVVTAVHYQVLVQSALMLDAADGR